MFHGARGEGKGVEGIVPLDCHLNHHTCRFYTLLCSPPLPTLLSPGPSYLRFIAASFLCVCMHLILIDNILCDAKMSSYYVLNLLLASAIFLVKSSLLNGKRLFLFSMLSILLCFPLPRG